MVHQVQEALGQPLFIYLNSMVILGKEPVIVDTGTPANRKQWLEDVFSLVEPKDVRWIFLLRQTRLAMARGKYAPSRVLS